MSEFVKGHDSFIYWIYDACFFVTYVGKVISEEYELEYGTDCLEMHVGAVQPGERALVIDDLVATGGTLSAAIKLLGVCCSPGLEIFCSPCFLLLII